MLRHLQVNLANADPNEVLPPFDGKISKLEWLSIIRGMRRPEIGQPVVGFFCCAPQPWAGAMVITKLNIMFIDANEISGVICPLCRALQRNV